MSPLQFFAHVISMEQTEIHAFANLKHLILVSQIRTDISIRIVWRVVLITL